MSGPFVLDASLALSWCFIDETTPYTKGVLASLRSTYAVVPALWPFEMANGLAIPLRSGRITESTIAEFLEVMRLLPIHIERREALWICQSVLPLTRKYGLSAYDGAYLELAIRDQMPLATLDGRLRSAAEAAGVPLVET